MISKALIPTRIKLFFCKDKELYSSLFHILGFYPNQIKYYKQALLHKSIRYKDDNGKRINNERLEFLGDAVLSMVVGDIVYRHFAGKPEGFLTVTRSKIVQRATLNQVSEKIGLDKLTRESTRHLTHNNNIYGNAFEALMGAIYLDRGYDTCMEFFQNRIVHHLINIDAVAQKEDNFKSRLIEWCQKNKIEVSFELKQQKMDGSSPVFYSQILVEGLNGGTGRGFSKKASQQEAAQETLALLKRQKLFYQNVLRAQKERLAQAEQAEQPQENEVQLSLPEHATQQTIAQNASEPAQKG